MLSKIGSFLFRGFLVKIRGYSTPVCIGWVHSSCANPARMLVAKIQFHPSTDVRLIREEESSTDSWVLGYLQQPTSRFLVGSIIINSNTVLTNMSSLPEGNCKFAIPKKGRLFEKVNDLLKGSGIEYNRAPRLDVALCKDQPITLVFLPASDIAKYVGEGNVDIGITGLDVVEESDVVVDKVMDLGFGACKLCVQAPVADKITDVSTLAGGRIVTSFPVLSEKFFKPLDEKKGVKTKITEVSGSVEAACGLGLADAVVDLVETGTTMKVRKKMLR